MLMLITILFVTLTFTLWLFIKNEAVRYFITMFYGVGTLLIGAELSEGDTEYQITLINQNKVKIKAMDSGRIYYCAPEEITETIDKDNL